MGKRIDAHEEFVKNLFDKCPIKLDIQTGSLVVRLPPVTSLLDRPIFTESDKVLARNNAILLVFRLASLVSPQTIKDKGPLGQLNTSIDLFYPTLRTRDPTHALLRMWTRPDSTWAGVWFRRWDKPTPFETSDAHVEEQGTEWLICRLPIRSHPSAIRDHEIVVPPLRDDPVSGEKWHLFDFRYWMRVENHGATALKIRNFEPKDVQTLTEDVEKMPMAERPHVRPDRVIRELLMLIQDKRSRRGFPGIFRTDDQGRDILVALPTFDLTVSLRETSHQALRCDIRYRKIDTGNRPLDDIVVPGVTKAQIADTVRGLTSESASEVAEDI
jgi:hypothetical protein